MVYNGRKYPLQEFGSYLIYIAGSNKKRMNLATKTVEDTNTDALTVIQATIDTLGNSSGKKIYLNAGFYSLVTTLNFSVIDGYSTLEGESGFGVTQLRPVTNIPAIEISGAKTKINLDKLYLTHNQAGYTTSLINIKNGPTRNRISNCYFYDFGTQVGNAVGLDATTASTYLNHMFNCETVGFENAVFANCGSASFFMNSNHFLLNNFWSPKRGLKVTGVSGAAFDDNTFQLCQVQSYAGTLCGFDYDTSSRALYTKHTNTVVWDLPALKNYADINTITEITLSGCFPSYKIGGSGATTGKVRAFDNYSTNRGKSTQSGNASTKVFNIVHWLGAGLTSIRITPGSVDATGTPAITSDATNVIITYPIAPPSGTNNLIWNWEANVF